MISKLPEWNLTNKRVLLRADLNVPIKHGKILDDTRLHALKPTLDLIAHKGGHCILLTHIGEPTAYDPELSTEHLIPWFKQHNYAIDFASTPADISSKKNNADARITLLENLRFFPGEQEHDQVFAQELAQLGDFYVNDAFGTLHRTDTSITLVPLLFSPDTRTIGLLVEKELHTLNTLREHPDHPFVLILGGSKAATKIPLIESFIGQGSKHAHANTVLLCPALAFTFAKAIGKPVGKSLVDDTVLNTSKKIMAQCQQHNVELILPIDYQISHAHNTHKFEIIDADNMPDDGIGISIGPKTVALFKKKMDTAKTIFFNGTPGFNDRPETLEGAKNLLRAITETSANTIICGGDSIAVAHMFGLLDTFTHVSTGGGATLTYLSGQPLPGLACL